MPKRQKRVKLSKAQILENDTNKWLAKKAAAIDMLVKAMDRLKSLDRSHRRLQKAALHPVQKKVTKREQPTPQAGMDVSLSPEQRAQRMESMGFRKTGRRKAQPAVTGQS